MPFVEHYFWNMNNNNDIPNHKYVLFTNDFTG